jgi:tetratricopeptide (TPR) repeat protein
VWRWVGSLGGAALLGALGFASASPGQQTDPDACDALVAADPADPAARLRAARCHFDAERFGAALALVEPAGADDPEAGLLRGMALYHLGRPDAAEPELARAEPQLGDRAELHFYRGMIHLQRSEWAAAASRLDRARRVDPAGVEPVASFHAARAWLELADRLRAREALERVERDWPGTPWAVQARRQLDGLEGRAPTLSWLLVEAGMESDDNVVLRGDGVQLPQEIADERDRRTVWLLHGGRELLRSGPWAGGGALTYSGSAHVDLDAFDTHYPSATLWLDRQLAGIGTARASYDFGYAWVDGDAFLVAHDASLGLFRGSRWGTTGLLARGYARDFRFALEDDLTTASNEAHERNRDGLGYALGIEHALSLLRRRAQARVLLELERYDARGSEYSFAGETLSAALHAGLPLELRGSVWAGWSHRVHRHSSTFPDPDDGRLRGRDRREDTLRFEVELARPLGDRLALIGRWRWLDNRSTSDVFDYRQQVFGIHLRLGLGESAP